MGKTSMLTFLLVDHGEQRKAMGVAELVREIVGSGYLIVSFRPEAAAEQIKKSHELCLSRAI